MFKFIKRILILAIAFNLSINSAYGQLITDGTTNTQIASGEFNTPVINIAAPNEKGLSHNKFTDYNVGSDNLIINNNREQNKISKIGGYVKENQNLVSAGREANIILNEVTGTGKTNLNGYTEMLGKNADLVIANPNGINIAGAGFINIPKVTLVTGSSNISAEGELENFNLSDTGVIDISKDSNNLGLSAENSSLYLSGRYVKIGGNIYANLINILTGSKSFNYLTKEADSYTPSSAPAATEYAVDASSLGGMYSGVINIIGTEEGFGVRNSATLVTDIGDIKIINKGTVEAENISSGKDLYIESEDAISAGNIDVKGNMDISARNITLNTFKSTGNVSLSSSGGNISSSTGVVGGDLYLYSTNNIFAYSISSNSDISMRSENTLKYVALKSARDMTFSAFNVTHEGSSEAGNNINIIADSFNIRPASDASEQVLLAYGDINFDIGTLNNTGEIAAFKDINVISNTLNNNGLILANNALNIEGGDINNNSGASLFGNNALNIKTDGTITNTLGSIYGNNNLTIEGLTGERSGDLNNIGGLIESRNGDINISSANINNLSIKNCDPDTETCYTTSWVDSGEVLKWIYHLAPTPLPYIIERKQVATSLLQAQEYGKILSGKDINLTASDIKNESGIISANNTIIINALNLHNIRSSFDVTLERQMYFPGLSGLTLYIEPKRWTETFSDNIFSTTPAVISANSVIINATGTVFNDAYTEGDASVPFDPLPVSQNFQDVISGGVINPVSTVDFSYSGLFKQAGPDSSYLYVTTNRFLDKRNYVGADYFFTQTGIDYNKQSIKLIGDVFYEQKLIEDSILRLTGSRSLNDYSENMNSQMTYLYNNAAQAYGDLGLTFGKALNTEQTEKLNKDIVWYVEQEVNGSKVYVPTLYLAKASKERLAQQGSESIVEGNNVIISTDDIVNSGTITADNLQIYAKGDIKNISGAIKANDNLDISAQGNISNESKRNLVKYAPVSTPMLVGLVMLEKPATKTAPDKFPWREATISSGGTLNITAGKDLINTSAEIFSGKDMSIDAGNDIKIQGHTLTDANIKNTSSNIIALGNAHIQAGNNIEISGSNVTAAKDLSLTSSNINILSAVDEHPIAYNPQKSVVPSYINGENILLNTTGDITNEGGIIKASNSLQAEAYNIVNSGNLSAKNMQLYADNDIHNISGVIKAENNLDIYAFGNVINETRKENLQDSSTQYGTSFSAKLAAIKQPTANEVLQETAQISSGGTLNITTANNFENISADISSVGDMTIYADKEISIESQELKTNSNISHQSSNLNSFADIYLYSGGKLDILGSNVDAKNALTLSGSEVNILSNIDETYEGQRLKKTNIASNISGAEINVIADKDINVTASNASSSAGNITFDAENVNVKSGINSNTYSVSSGSFQLEDSSTNNDGSTIDSSNDINMIAEDTFELTASDLYAANNINIIARDVNIQSGQDTTHYYRYNVKKRSFGRKKIEEDRRDTITNVSSEVVAGGNLNISSYNDINIIGSNLTTDNGSMVLQAGNDIDVLAGINQEATLTRREKKGLLGLSGSKDVTYDNIKTLESSSVFSGDDIKLTSGADTTLFASDVGAKGDGSIQTGGDLNIFSGVDSTYHYEEHIKRSFDPLETLKSIAENLYNSSGPLGMINEANKLKDAAETGRYEVFNVNLYKETIDTLEKYNETLHASTLNFGGKLDLNSTQDANIKGSEVNAEGGIDINADNINITAQELINTSKTEHEDKQVSLSAGISNAYLNTALTLNAAKEAAEDLKKAQDTYNNIKDLYDQGKATKSALDDAKENLALATTNLAMQTYAAITASSGLTGSAATSFGTGIQGDLGLSASSNKSSSQSSGSTQAGSNLWSNDDINLTSTKDITQQGSSIVSGQITETGILGGGDINYTAGGDINIEASANTNNTSSSSSSQSGSIGATTGGSVNVNFSQNKSSSTSNDLWWTNSTAATGDGSINISSGEDTSIKGANIFGKDVSINTGGDLLVESLQDEHHSSGSSSGFSGSMGTSGNTSTYVPSLGAPTSQSGITPGGGINQSSNGADSAWVNNQTTVIGKDSVTVTADTTDIKGGVIANIDENGQDGGNLQLDTNKLEYSDINDYSNSYESGWGIQTNLPINTSGGQGALDSAKDSILHPSGSTTITQKDASAEKEQETRATIGEGNITIEGKEATEEQTDGLNRDTENTQEITKDQVTGALDYNITVDHEVAVKFIDKGVEISKEILNTIATIPGGVATFFKDVMTVSAQTGLSQYEDGITYEQTVDLTKRAIDIEAYIKNQQREKTITEYLKKHYNGDETKRSIVEKWLQENKYIEQKMKYWDDMSPNEQDQYTNRQWDNFYELSQDTTTNKETFRSKQKTMMLPKTLINQAEKEVDLLILNIINDQRFQSMQNEYQNLTPAEQIEFLSIMKDAIKDVKSFASDVLINIRYSDKVPSASFNKPNKVNMDIGEKVYLKNPDSVLVHEIMGHMGIEENKSQTIEYISLKKSQSDEVYAPSTSALYKYQISEKMSYLYQYLYEKNKHKLQKIGKNEK